MPEFMWDIEQGTDEWLRARLGVFSASEASKLVSPTGKASTQMPTLAAHKAYEKMCGSPAEDYLSEWMQRGRDMEDLAIFAYEDGLGSQVQKVGFVKMDEIDVGCSPDGIVNLDSGRIGLVEVKCPAPWNHMRYLAFGTKGSFSYYPQIQMQLHVTGADWLDFISYHPEFSLFKQRFGPDKKFIDTLKSQLEKALEQRDQLIEKVQKVAA